ncbi:MAG: hypothetical protein ACFCVC_12040 [Acidimicrobiia bacterium]
MTSALATPTHQDLIAIMSNQRRLLEQLLFRHAEISMLIAAGEHRFVGRAIDEALEVEAELGAVELLRAMTTIGIDGDVPISKIIAGAPTDAAAILRRLADDMGRLLEEVARYRTQAATWAGERAEMVARAVTGFGAQTYSAGRGF